MSYIPVGSVVLVGAEGPDKISFSNSSPVLNSRTNRAGLPVNFGRGVTRAVYLLVSQSFSALSLCRRLRLLQGQPAKGSIFTVYGSAQGVAMGSHEAAAGHSETRTPH